MSNELTPQQRAVLADAFGDDPTYQEREWEHVILVWEQGKLVAYGPYPRELAERKAEKEGCTLVRRVKTTSWGSWTRTDPGEGR